MDHTQLIKVFVAVFVILNPLSALPVFLSMTLNASKVRKRQIALQVGLAIMVILVISTWLGTQILDFLGIKIAAFKVAGGIIVLLMGLAMLHAKPSSIQHEANEDTTIADQETTSIAVVPLAIPLLAGPGAISTVLIYAQQYHSFYDHVQISMISMLISAIIAAIFACAPLIEHIVGKSGINVIARVMGMILASIAIEILSEGLIGLFPVLLR